jgi:hypothetical protein
MDIWCIGDLGYLISVLSALAMIGNSGLFVDLVKIGVALGIIAAGNAAGT